MTLSIFNQNYLLFIKTVSHFLAYILNNTSKDYSSQRYLALIVDLAVLVLSVKSTSIKQVKCVTYYKRYVWRAVFSAWHVGSSHAWLRLLLCVLTEQSAAIVFTTFDNLTPKFQIHVLLPSGYLWWRGNSILKILGEVGDIF